jgi:hypothetical protein
MSGNTLWLWLTLAIAGTAANEIWRIAGVWLSRGVDPVSPVMLWVKDLSTALVAGLVARMLLLPAGELAAIGITVRFLAFGTGIAAFLLGGRHLAIALACAEAMFFAAQAALGAGL